MSKFHPLKIELEILTSIVHGNYYPIHLDGLVYWAIRNFSRLNDSLNLFFWADRSQKSLFVCVGQILKKLF